MRSPQVKGIVGPLVDQEGIFAFKKFFNELGVSNLHIEDVRRDFMRVDFRSNYLLNVGLMATGLRPVASLMSEKNPDKELQIVENPKGEKDTKIDYTLLISNNPRIEASLFNVKLRELALRFSAISESQSVKKNALTIATIGTPMNLTYACKHLGNGTQSLILLATGKHRALEDLLFSKNPSVILGMSILQRKDNSGVKATLNQILDTRQELLIKVKKNLDRKKNGRFPTASGQKGQIEKRASYKHNLVAKTLFFNGSSIEDYQVNAPHQWNVLHASANTCGALDLGLSSNKGISRSHTNQDNSRQSPKALEILYLLNTKAANLKESTRPGRVDTSDLGDTRSKDRQRTTQETEVGTRDPSLEKFPLTQS